MGLFSKKSPCPICGEKVSGLLPKKIEGEAICKGCSEKIDVDKSIGKDFTLSSFKDYLAFYEENQKLAARFQVEEVIDFGAFDTKIAFDFKNNLFCMSKKLDKTIFEGSQIQSFSIREDGSNLFDCVDGQLMRHQSPVPNAIMILAPILHEIARHNHEHRDGPPPRDIHEPFDQFILNVDVDHPYWYNLVADMSGPKFSNQHPDAHDFMREYDRDVAVMEQLSNAFMRIMGG